MGVYDQSKIGNAPSRGGSGDEKLLFWTFSSWCAAPSPLLAAAMELHPLDPRTRYREFALESVRV